MLAQVRSAALRGIEAFAVAVEVDVSFGLPVFAMVGLPDASVRESRDRVRAAIRNSGFEFPGHRITVNLAPADVRKAGASFDLPIAVAILAAAGIVPRLDPARVAIVGELSLDGAVLPTRGVLPVAIGLQRQGIDALLLPTTNAAEAAVVEALRVVPIATLADAVARLRESQETWPRVTAPAIDGARIEAVADLVDVRGQASARRALEIAAAGGHHLLLVGPPGAGKTLLARRMPGILPALTFDEALEVTAIHSVAGKSIASEPSSVMPLGVITPGLLAKAQITVTRLPNAPTTSWCAMATSTQPPSPSRSSKCSPPGTPAPARVH